MHITSRDNSLLRQTRAVRDGKIENLIFVEGLRLCEEALRSNLSIEALICSEELIQKDRVRATIESLTRAAKRTGVVSEKLLESVSYTKTPQGVILLASKPTSGRHLLSAVSKDHGLVVVMHQINNPVNVGAILRTAEAASADGAIATVNTNDPFSPKSLRGAMGSAFRLPIWTGATYSEVIDWCSQKGFISVCTDADAPQLYTDLNWTKGIALILGPESTGLSNDEVKAAEIAVRIPMDGLVESLNVSVAAGILLFEAQRQRRATPS